MYYASIGMLSMAVLIIVNYEALKNYRFEDKHTAKHKYRQFLLSVMVYFFSDILWGMLYAERLIALTYADTVLYFLAMVVSVLFWTRFVVTYLENKNAFGKVLISAGWIITTYQIIALIINFFTPIVFGFNADKEYLPGTSRYMTLFMQMILFIMTSIYSFIIAFKSEGNAKLHHRTVGFSGVAMTIFIALQSLFPLLPFYAVGCLLATCMVHTFVYRDERVEYSREIGTTKQLAYRDALTGVKNKLAYLEKLKEFEIQLAEGNTLEYAVAVFDLNDLKKVNDTQGHEAGDKYIQEACRFICHRFKHSPVFRIGGDEFVAIMEGHDYENRNAILKGFEKDVDQNQAQGLVVVSSGLSVFNPEGDESFNDVFMRADKEMYERKALLKERVKNG